MNQCLRCKRPCAGTAVFCDGCQSSLLHRSQQKEYSTEPIFSLPGEAAIPASPPPPEGALSSRMRLAFIIVGIAAAVVLCVDIALVLLSFSQQDQASRMVAHVPSTAAGTPGAIVPLSLSPSSSSPQSGPASPASGTTIPTGTTALPVSGTVPPATPLLEISPSSLIFSITQGQGNPAAQIVTIAYAGVSTLYWQENPASSNVSWLECCPAVAMAARRADNAAHDKYCQRQACPRHLLNPDRCYGYRQLRCRGAGQPADFLGNSDRFPTMLDAGNTAQPLFFRFAAATGSSRAEHHLKRDRSLHKSFMESFDSRRHGQPVLAQTFCHLWKSDQFNHNRLCQCPGHTPGYTYRAHYLHRRRRQRRGTG